MIFQVKISSPQTINKVTPITLLFQDKMENTAHVDAGRDLICCHVTMNNNVLSNPECCFCVMCASGAHWCYKRSASMANTISEDFNLSRQEWRDKKKATVDDIISHQPSGLSDIPPEESLDDVLDRGLSNIRLDDQEYNRCLDQVRLRTPSKSKKKDAVPYVKVEDRSSRELFPPNIQVFRDSYGAQGLAPVMRDEEGFQLDTPLFASCPTAVIPKSKYGVRPEPEPFVVPVPPPNVVVTAQPRPSRVPEGLRMMGNDFDRDSDEEVPTGLHEWSGDQAGRTLRLDGGLAPQSLMPPPRPPKKMRATRAPIPIPRSNVVSQQPLRVLDASVLDAVIPPEEDLFQL